MKKVAKKEKSRTWKQIKKHYELYLMLLIPCIYIFVFKYIPMYGAQIAFKDYNIIDGIWGSEWVDFKHFKRLFGTPNFWDIVKNTFTITFYNFFASVPLPILFAIGINYARNKFFKKTVQMITYLPHFLSVVIIVSLMNMMFNIRNGAVINIWDSLFGSRPDILLQSSNFKHLFVWSDVWQNIGWSSIIYVSALAGVDPTYHEAAIVDGANKWKRVWYVDLPTIMPTIVIMLVMKVGQLVTVSFDKAFLMQNAINLDVSEVISTYEYKMGMGAQIPQYSYPAAIGLVSAVVTLILVVLSNKLANKLSGSGLW